MVIYHYYKCPALSPIRKEVVEGKISEAVPECRLSNLHTETCFYVVTETDLSAKDEEKLQWILSTPFEKAAAKTSSLYTDQINEDDVLVEIGPRLNFSTAFSTNAVSVCHSIGLNQVSRLERSIRYLMSFSDDRRPSIKDEEKIVSVLHDRMTECRYRKPVETFDLDVKADEVYEVDIMKYGRGALEKANKDLGLAFDSWDLDYYTKLFIEDVQRNPTNVECFDLAQSNSEHSRHWFFRGRLIIDGEECPDSLFQMIMATQEGSNDNNIIKFNDNSSGIKGFPVSVLLPSEPQQVSEMVQRDDDVRHIIFTAETHNFPTGVAPFPGATTGTGGRIRDVHCTGKGAHVIAGTAGYSFGNLHIPGYPLPWEDETLKYPGNFALPVDIAIEASNGASDYGNKFGEPVLAGFARSFGMITESGERREYIKPIMFSGGIGMLHDAHIKKEAPKLNMEVVKVGGPVYRIGVGGGSASSVEIQGDNKVDLDFGAVQRGDAEMEQKLNRLIRACIEMGDMNPIRSIHDQGAGGNGNVLKELVDPAGARILVENFQLGDPTLSALEIWAAEYQESNAMLVESKDISKLRTIAKRERCPICVVGTVTGDGKVVLVDRFSSSLEQCSENGSTTKRPKLDDKRHPVDLELQHVLGKMPRKVFHMESKRLCLKELSLPDQLSVREALNRVLRLPSVASKRYLTNKVDRSVTGLVAQQQCVGPLHTPLADVAVTALSYFNTVGAATAIGEQPIKGLIDPAAGARMSVGEALTNLVFARITELRDVKCSGNWMWPAKLPGEGAALLDACSAMCDVMKALGIAVDGGKDSLSMAARVGDETVKAPGTLVISAYAGCPDIRATVTSDLKCPSGKGALLYVSFSGSQQQQFRLGGSALAQCYNQIGEVTPDLDDPGIFAHAFNITQTLIKDGVVTAGHDVSDGGLITCLLEMAFAGNCSIDVNITAPEHVTALHLLFSEELGIVIEMNEDNLSRVISAFTEASVQCYMIGYSLKSDVEAAWIKIGLNAECVLDDHMAVLRDIWEETSFQLERRQANPHCVSQEQEGLKNRKEPAYHITDTLKEILGTEIPRPECVNRPKVAIIREEGSNSDREMAAAFHMAGFECWDINMQDLCEQDITLEQFRGLAFVGGFSYADVLGSAKGWAATALFNSAVQDKFTRFRNRSDTFSLGVCNGCQLMALLGWIAPDASLQNGAGDAPLTDIANQGVLLGHNESERFESRFSTVRVSDSPSIMLCGLEGTVFGMWVSHGEGKILFKNASIKDHVVENKLAPIRYVDDEGKPTEQYPLNPNGSTDGIAALCSLDGRHLAIMPHPERCFISWQCPWIPEDWRNTLQYSPWIQIFRNAFEWCQKD